MTLGMQGSSENRPRRRPRARPRPKAEYDDENEDEYEKCLAPGAHLQVICWNAFG